MTSRTTHHPPPPSRPDLLQEWVAAGLISDEQARAIRQHEAEPHERRAELTLVPSRAAGPSLVVEALGYLGGVVMLVGAGILVGMYWPDISVALRLVLVGATAVALVGAGFAVPDRLGEAAGRLRAVLWAAGVVATGWFLGVFSVDVLDRTDEHALVIIGPGTAVVAAVLWWLRPTWLQQLALFVPLLIGTVGVAMELTSTDSWAGGFAIWVVAVAWAAVSWSGRLEPRGTGVALGVLGAVLGSLTMANDAGIALGLTTAVAAVALALWERSLLWLAVSAIAMLWTTPRAAYEWFPGRLSAALTFLVTGGLLLAAAVWVARHREPDSRPRE
jgi:hypothetical protein